MTIPPSVFTVRYPEKTNEAPIIPSIESIKTEKILVTTLNKFWGLSRTIIGEFVNLVSTIQLSAEAVDFTLSHRTITPVEKHKLKRHIAGIIKAAEELLPVYAAIENVIDDIKQRFPDSISNNRGITETNFQFLLLIICATIVKVEEMYDHFMRPPELKPVLAPSVEALQSIMNRLDRNALFSVT